MVNGYLDESKLVLLDNFHPIDSHAGGLVLPEVARQWKLMAADCQRDTGYRLDASEGYRSFAGQVYQKQKWTALGKPGNAAQPGTSTHGEAKAVDAGSGAGTDGHPVETWLEKHAADYGFSRPFWYELWHLLYVGNPKITTPREEDELTPAEKKLLSDMSADLKKVKTDLAYVKAEVAGPTPANSRIRQLLTAIRNLSPAKTMKDPK